MSYGTDLRRLKITMNNWCWLVLMQIIHPPVFFFFFFFQDKWKSEFKAKKTQTGNTGSQIKLQES